LRQFDNTAIGRLWRRSLFASEAPCAAVIEPS